MGIFLSSLHLSCPSPPSLSPLSLATVTCPEGRKGKVVPIKSLDTYTVCPNLLSAAAIGTDCDQKQHEEEIGGAGWKRGNVTWQNVG